MKFTDDDLKGLKDDCLSMNYSVELKFLRDEILALLARLEAGSKCAQLLADYADHEHGYWSSPKEIPRCKGVNSIDECDFTMNLRRQFKEAVKAWRKASGK